MDNIKCLISLSGKRCTGKDYIGEDMVCEFKKIFDINSQYVQASTEIKKQFAAVRDLDPIRLQNERIYKELYREEMTAFSKKQMEEEGEACYNKLLVKNIFENTMDATIYVVPTRFLFEIELYQSLGIPLINIRINVDDRVRAGRGWKYDGAIDNDPSETDLDNYGGWDYVFDNSKDGNSAIRTFTTDCLIPKLRAEFM